MYICTFKEYSAVLRQTYHTSVITLRYVLWTFLKDASIAIFYISTPYNNTMYIFSRSDNKWFGSKWPSVSHFYQGKAARATTNISRKCWRHEYGGTHYFKTSSRDVGRPETLVEQAVRTGPKSGGRGACNPTTRFRHPWVEQLRYIYGMKKYHKKSALYLKTLSFLFDEGIAKIFKKLD